MLELHVMLPHALTTVRDRWCKLITGKKNIIGCVWGGGGGEGGTNSPKTSIATEQMKGVTGKGLMVISAGPVLHKRRLAGSHE